MEEMGRSSEEGDRGGQPECFDGLGEEGEPIDGLHLRVENRDSGRDREPVGGYQPRQHGSRGEDGTLSCTKGQSDRKDHEEGGRGDETTSGAGSFRKVLGDEGAVDPGADRAGDDENVTLEPPTTYPSIAVRHVQSPFGCLSKGSCATAGWSYVRAPCGRGVREDLVRVEAEKAVLLRPDLVHEDVVVARVLVALLTRASPCFAAISAALGAPAAIASCSGSSGRL
jgi:hypothetical protein